jgi:hypothetical protein
MEPGNTKFSLAVSADLQENTNTIVTYYTRYSKDSLVKQVIFHCISCSLDQLFTTLKQAKWVEAKTGKPVQ